jgi:hypothetical protein
MLRVNIAKVEVSDKGEIPKNGEILLERSL